MGADGTIVMGHSWSGTSASDPTYWAGPLGGEPTATSFGSWPPGYSSGQAHVFATSADGAVAGGYFRNAGTYAFLWSATNGWELLDPLPGHGMGRDRSYRPSGGTFLWELFATSAMGAPAFLQRLRQPPSWIARLAAVLADHVREAAAQHLTAQEPVELCMHGGDGNRAERSGRRAR